MEVKGERMSGSEGILWEKLYTTRGWEDEYMLSIKESDTFIDTTAWRKRAKYANHYCSPNEGF